MGQSIEFWDNGTFVPMGQDRTGQWDICPKKQGHLSS